MYGLYITQSCNFCFSSKIIPNLIELLSHVACQINGISSYGPSQIISNHPGNAIKFIYGVAS